MAGACPVPAADAPLVRSLLAQTDCHVRGLTHAGYAALFQGSGGLAPVLTALMTLYVALIGYQLMLGRMELRVGEVTLSAIKLAAVTAFASQWDTYQPLVFGGLFDGPAQIATAMLHGMGDSAGDIFDGLQSAIDALTAASTGFPQNGPAQAASLLGGAGFGALALNATAGLLLLSSLGVVLASKIVLGVLLATGPTFIALALFDTTRGLFEGWLRATLAFAFAPLAVMLLLAVILSILEPNLVQLAELRAKGDISLAPVYGVVTLVVVFAGVSAAMAVAAGVVFGGFRLPAKAPTQRAQTQAPRSAAASVTEAAPSRAARIAAAIAVQARREQVSLAGGYGGFSPSSTTGGGVGASAAAARGLPSVSYAEPQRLGQAARRRVAPRTMAGQGSRRPK